MDGDVSAGGDVSERGGGVLERELRKPVADWMRAQNLQPVVEMVTSHIADMIGIEYAERVGRKRPEAIRVVSVELKLLDIAGVIRQASTNRLYTDASFAAMPVEIVERMLPKTIGKFRAAGVGLLAVDGDEVRVVIEPVPELSMTEYAFRTERIVKNHWRRLRLDAKHNPRI